MSDLKNFIRKQSEDELIAYWNLFTNSESTFSMYDDVIQLIENTRSCLPWLADVESIHIDATFSEKEYINEKINDQNNLTHKLGLENYRKRLTTANFLCLTISYSGFAHYQKPDGSLQQIKLPNLAVIDYEADRSREKQKIGISLGLNAQIYTEKAFSYLENSLATQTASSEKFKLITIDFSSAAQRNRQDIRNSITCLKQIIKPNIIEYDSEYIFEVNENGIPESAEGRYTDSF